MNDADPGLHYDLEGWYQIAAFLHVDVSTAKRWIKRGIPVYKRFGRVMAWETELRDWLSANTNRVG